jgi:hypothetical protein
MYIKTYFFGLVMAVRKTYLAHNSWYFTITKNLFRQIDAKQVVHVKVCKWSQAAKSLSERNDNFRIC